MDLAADDDQDLKQVISVENPSTIGANISLKIKPMASKTNIYILSLLGFILTV